MTVKDKFTDEEWKHLVQSPMVAGIAITAADPSGLWGMIKESFGVAMSLKEAKANHASDSLPAQISASFETSEGRQLAQDKLKDHFKGKKPAEVAELAVARLGEASAVVAAKAPEELETYKAFIREIAQKVAEAGTEGGFLGFGGEKVSDDEKKTLSDIDRALG